MFSSQKFAPTSLIPTYRWSSPWETDSSSPLHRSVGECRGLNAGSEYQFGNIYAVNNYLHTPCHYYISISWIFLLDAFSIKAFNSVNFSQTSDFFFIKKTHVYLEKSSIKFGMYLDPFMDVIGMGPLISECISPKMHDSRISFPRLNLCSGCFPTTQPLQIPVVALMTGRPSTMNFFCNFYKYLNFMWPNLSCQILLTSFPWVSRAVGFASSTKWENS